MDATAFEKSLNNLGSSIDDAEVKLEDAIKMHQDQLDMATKMEAAAKDLSSAATATRAAADADLKAAQCFEKMVKEMKKKFDVCDALQEQGKETPVTTTGSGPALNGSNGSNIPVGQTAAPNGK